MKCDESRPYCQPCKRLRLDCDFAYHSNGVQDPNSARDEGEPSEMISSSSTMVATDLSPGESSSTPPAVVTVDLDSPSWSWSPDWQDPCLPTSLDLIYPIDTPSTIASTPSHSILGDSVREPFVTVFFESILNEVFHTVAAGPSNPFLAAMLPLIHCSTTVLAAIQALAGLYIGSTEGYSLKSSSLSNARVEGLKFQGDAIRLLARELSDPSTVNSDTVLASSLVLCLCEQVRSGRWAFRLRTDVTVLSRYGRIVVLFQCNT